MNYVAAVKSQWFKRAMTFTCPDSQRSADKHNSPGSGGRGCLWMSFWPGCPYGCRHKNNIMSTTGFCLRSFWGSSKVTQVIVSRHQRHWSVNIQAGMETHFPCWSRGSNLFHCSSSALQHVFSWTCSYLLWRSSSPGADWRNTRSWFILEWRNCRAVVSDRRQTLELGVVLISG